MVADTAPDAGLVEPAALAVKPAAAPSAPDVPTIEPTVEPAATVVEPAVPPSVPAVEPAAPDVEPAATVPDPAAAPSVPNVPTAEHAAPAVEPNVPTHGFHFRHAWPTPGSGAGFHSGGEAGHWNNYISPRQHMGRVKSHLPQDKFFVGEKTNLGESPSEANTTLLPCQPATLNLGM